MCAHFACHLSIRKTKQKMEEKERKRWNLSRSLKVKSTRIPSRCLLFQKRNLLLGYFLLISSCYPLVSSFSSPYSQELNRTQSLICLVLQASRTNNFRDHFKTKPCFLPWWMGITGDYSYFIRLFSMRPPFLSICAPATCDDIIT